MTVTPFTIAVPDTELDDLRRRLAATRWPDAVAEDWSQGTAPSDLRRLVGHWGGAYDWRAAERRLNQLDHVMVDGIHAIRAGMPGATPLLLVHGWPDGFVRFLGALPHLADRFEIVVPSVPGFGFSDRPTTALGPALVADRFATLMSELGHEQFAVHGADIGSSISEQLALRHPDRVTALHLGSVPPRRVDALDPAVLTGAELDLIERTRQWDEAEGAYAHLQRTKPQTLAASLNDSPAGLASWVLEKFRAWTDPDGDVFEHFTLDDLSTNLTVYWVTQTTGSAGRYYYDSARAELSSARITVPTGMALFPNDLLTVPRASAERWYPVQRWTEMPSGGHFGPWQHPEAWSAELRAFADQLGL